MQITFKLLEIASNIFSKSNQLKGLYLTSLTEGFNLKLNIFESISNNLSHTINYKGSSQKIKLCLMKGKICIGIGQISITNKKQKIEIYPENYKNFSKKIKLTILCCNNSKKILNDKILKNTDRTNSNTNNFNNSNTNNTSTLSISSYANSVIHNKIKSTQVNKINKKNRKYYRNQSQNNLNENSQNKKLYLGLKQKNNYMHDKINDNTTLFSERNKRHYSGNVSLNSYFSENIKKNIKKIFSPKISINSHPLYKESINNVNYNKKNKNNSMILSNDKKNAYEKIFKFTNDINIDNINNQIENYIIDKSYEDELQNDIPIIYPREQKNILNNGEFKGNKFEQLLNDFLLLYNNDNIKNLNLNEIELEFHFLVEKIYELINEYYTEYFSLNSENNSSINKIKLFGIEYNNLLKLDNLLRKKINKTNLKNTLKNNKNNKYYSSNIKKLNNEMNILKNINLGLINKNIKKESSKKLLKDIFLVIVNKNKSHLTEKQIANLKQVNIKININDINKTNHSKNKSMTNINKRIFNHNIYHKYQNAKKRTPLENINKKSINSKSKDISSNKVFENSLHKIKVKTKY